MRAGVLLTVATRACVADPPEFLTMMEIEYTPVSAFRVMVPEVPERLAGPETAAKAGAAVTAITTGALQAVAAPTRSAVRRSIPLATFTSVTAVPHPESFGGWTLTPG